ncbi:hypothetical protein PMEGAPR236_06250 [Priestia megaterium]
MLKKFLKEVPRLCTKGSTLKKDVFYVYPFYTCKNIRGILYNDLLGEGININKKKSGKMSAELTVR